MADQLAFVLINPYTIAKSRTGGVISRIVSRTDLDFVGARMFGPCQSLVSAYAELIDRSEDDTSPTKQLIVNYVRRAYAPNPATGRPRRVMLLLFAGENAIEKIWKITGSATLRSDTGETIRDTYGDYISGEDGQVLYFEPAILAAPTVKRAEKTLRLWARHSREDGGITATAMDVPEGESVEQTLVLLKPDNFRFPSTRPGNIIDVLSSTGLRIVGVKRFCMTVAQAEDFYGPVREVLCSKFINIGAERAFAVLEKEFGFKPPQEAIDELCARLGPAFAEDQFESIVEFMTGFRPSAVEPAQKRTCGKECCLALVYEGMDAIRKIRATLGPTDPRKAHPGSVRRDFGSDIMVNAAHASDSVESARREMGIVNAGEDTISALIDKYYGGGRVRAAMSAAPSLAERGMALLKKWGSRMRRKTAA